MWGKLASKRGEFFQESGARNLRGRLDWERDVFGEL